MGREKNIEAIQLFGGFENKEIDAFLSAASRKSVRKDHVFFATGSHNASLFIIVSGSVKIDRPGTTGDIRYDCVCKIRQSQWAA